MSFIQQVATAIGVELIEESVSDSKSESAKKPLVEGTVEEKKETDEQDLLDISETSIPLQEESKQSMIEIMNLGQQVDENHRLDKSIGRDDASASTATSISFGSVQVREYERVIDSTDKYMGLTLGWNYNQTEPSPVRERNHAKKYGGGASHGGDESRMKRTNGSDRYGMLIKYGYQQKELRQATKEAAQFYKQRNREAARSLVVAEERKKPKRRPLLRSMFS